MDLATYYRCHCAPYIRARLHRQDEGASLVEYALLVALIAVVSMVAITFVGRRASNNFSMIGSTIN